MRDSIDSRSRESRWRVWSPRTRFLREGTPETDQFADGRRLLEECPPNAPNFLDVASFVSPVRQSNHGRARRSVRRVLGEVAADRGGSLKQTQQRHKTVFAPPKTHTSVRQVRAMESFQECVAAKPRGDVLVDYPKPDDERSQGGHVVLQLAAAPRDFAPVQSRHPDPEQVAELIA